MDSVSPASRPYRRIVAKVTALKALGDGNAAGLELAASDVVSSKNKCDMISAKVCRAAISSA